MLKLDDVLVIRKAMWQFIAETIDFDKIDCVQIDFDWKQFWLKVICVLINLCESEMSYKFVCESQFKNQKLQIWASSRTNSKGRINFTLQQPNIP